MKRNMKIRFFLSLSMIFAFIFNNCINCFAIQLTDSETVSHTESPIVQEDISKRGEFEKHFICEDGSYIAATYNEPIHIKSSSGQWEEIDNTLSVIDNQITNKNKQFQTTFSHSATSNKMVSLSNEDAKISWYGIVGIWLYQCYNSGGNKNR